MNTLIRHIEYLISRNDCVIIPGFGAVLATSANAYFDQDTGMMMPPRRHFAFNGALRHNDGTLACSIARAEGIPYDDANDKVTKSVTALKARLREFAMLPLGRIGTLTYDADTDNVTFAPFAYDCLSVETCAYLPISVNQEAFDKPSHEEETHEPPIFITPHYPSRWSMAVRIAASLLLLLGICFVASTPLPFDDAAMASLTPEIRQTTVEELVPTVEKCNYIIACTSHPEGIAEPINPSILPDGEGVYFAIVASFPNIQDAEKYIQATAPHQLCVLEKQGRYRVYAASYATEADAYAGLPEVNKKYNQAWICRK